MTHFSQNITFGCQWIESELDRKWENVWNETMIWTVTSLSCVIYSTCTDTIFRGQEDMQSTQGQWYALSDSWRAVAGHAGSETATGTQTMMHYFLTPTRCHLNHVFSETTQHDPIIFFCVCFALLLLSRNTDRLGIKGAPKLL